MYYINVCWMKKMKNYNFNWWLAIGLFSLPNFTILKKDNIFILNDIKILSQYLDILNLNKSIKIYKNKFKISVIVSLFRCLIIDAQIRAIWAQSTPWCVICFSTSVSVAILLMQNINQSGSWGMSTLALLFSYSC